MQISFKSVRIFVTIRGKTHHKNPNWDVTNQCWVCTRWSTKPEVEFGFERGANYGFGIDFIWSRTITYAIIYHFPVKFVYGSKMWSARCLLFMRQTRSIHTILEVCEFRFLPVSQLRLPCFSTDRHKNSNRFKTNLHWLYLENQRNPK